MHVGCERCGPSTELGRKFHFQPTARVAVKNGAARDWLAEHFFKTERLCAKLDEIAVIRLASAALVLDGKGLRAELDDIGASGETEATG